MTQASLQTQGSELTPNSSLGFQFVGCEHPFPYFVLQQKAGKFFCGLCWLRDGIESEIPSRLHAYRVLAENGNPEMAGKFVAHLETILGLKPPKKGESLSHFRASRVQYRRAVSLFPVTSALHKLMGVQPPIANVTVKAVLGVPEESIAQELSYSLWNTFQMVSKGVRATMRMIRSS